MIALFAHAPKTSRGGWRRKRAATSIAESGWRQAIYYFVVGMGWVLPAMPIVSWMQRPDRAKSA